MNEDLIQKFGFSEMYEWAKIPNRDEPRLGRFVTFDSENPGKIVMVNKPTQNVLGITTVNSAIDSDDPSEWNHKNMCNEFGDMYLRREKLAVGQKVYDQLNEMNYIRTSPWEHFIPITNQYFNDKLKYTKRSNRAEWVRVNLLGKAIVEDNGKCQPGTYCTPYTGKIKGLFGTAVPADEKSKQKFYVVSRFSEKTIIVLNK